MRSSDYAIIVLLALMAFVIWLPAPADGQGLGTSQWIVTDGDTIKSPAGVSYRIVGLDAPETFRAQCDEEYARGQAAKKQLERLLASGTVTLREGKLDKYRRTLAHVYVNGRDVADLMIKSGHARPYDGQDKRQPWCP